MFLGQKQVIQHNQSCSGILSVSKKKNTTVKGGNMEKLHLHDGNDYIHMIFIEMML